MALRKRGVNLLIWFKKREVSRKEEFPSEKGGAGVSSPGNLRSNILRLEKFRDPKFGTNVSNQKLLNAVKYQGYSFYHFWILKGGPTGGG